LQKSLGEKVKVFDMGEIVREALQYVDPKAAKEEAADPKGKGKKAAADAPADIFAGQDTTRYKEIASLLIKQIQLTTGNQESIPGKDTDLLLLISDDNLLV